MLKQRIVRIILESKKLRYLLSGGSIFVLNIVLMWFFVDVLGFSTSAVARNLSHLGATELALLFGFFLHDNWTWQEKKKYSFWKRFLSYHAIALAGIMLRLIAFMLLDMANLHWLIATILPLAFVVVINFIGFDNISFRRIAKNNTAYQEGAIGSKTLETIEDARRYNVWLSDMFRPYLGKRNVELGAGQGTISALLLHDFPLILTDLSEDNLNFLQKRFSGNKNLVDAGKDLLQMLGSHAPVDCIYSSNVLEHIANDIALVCDAAKYISSGGYFVAIVPALNVLYSDFDQKIGHYRRYNKNYIKSNTEIQKKYNIVKLKYFDPLGALGWWFNMKLLGSQELSRGSLSLYEALVPMLRIFDKLPQPFGKNLLIVLQKK